MPVNPGPWFIDTNILLRLSTGQQAKYPEVRLALNRLQRLNPGIFCAAQNIAEFWNVSTRPADKNGFGLTIPEVQEELNQLETVIAVLPETLEVFLAHEVRGVQVHDARLAANMRVHGVRNLLTLNGRDFRRFPDIAIFAPADLP